jgi:hypothetical protein
MDRCIHWTILGCLSITVAARSKAWTVFARSNTGVVGSNDTRDMDVCVRLFCVCVVLCVGSGVATGWAPVKRVLPTVYGLRNWKSGQGPTEDCRAIERYILGGYRWICCWDGSLCSLLERNREPKEAPSISILCYRRFKWSYLLSITIEVPFINLSIGWM